MMTAGFRGARCRDKEAAQSQALTELETATKNHALTDRAAKLDVDIAALKAKIEKAGPVLEANSQGSALARLFDMPDAKAVTLSTYQNLAMAMVIEFLIVISLVASEVIGRGEKTPAPAAANPTMAARKAEQADKETGPVLEAVAVDGAPVTFPAPPKPRLISSRPDPVGSVATILAEIMEPGRGKVEIADVFEAYAEACEAGGKRPVPVNEFPAAMAALCKKLGIKLEDSEAGVFLLRVRIRRSKKIA